MESVDHCPCGHKKTFKQCCGRFLSGDQHAKTPEQLMRSRYSAYALGGYGDYLIETWFPVTAASLDVADLSEQTHDWFRLEVLNKSQSGDNGEVEFKAYYRNKDGSSSYMHESSTFKRNRGHWYYVGAKVSIR
jgi:SEC-C motif-containing protein